MPHTVYKREEDNRMKTDEFISGTTKVEFYDDNLITDNKRQKKILEIISRIIADGLKKQMSDAEDFGNHS